jgi:hypothetical protein
MAFSTAFQPNAFQNNAFQIGMAVVETTTFSRHPVNCVMAHDIVGVKKRISEWQVPKQEMKDSPRATKSPVNRLARYPAPSFTVKTGPANRID